MESIHSELALLGSKNKCAETDYVFSFISEVCDGTVSLRKKNIIFVQDSLQQMLYSLYKIKVLKSLTTTFRGSIKAVFHLKQSNLR